MGRGSVASASTDEHAWVHVDGEILETLQSLYRDHGVRLVQADGSLAGRRP